MFKSHDFYNMSFVCFVCFSFVFLFEGIVQRTWLLHVFCCVTWLFKVHDLCDLSFFVVLEGIVRSTCCLSHVVFLFVCFVCFEGLVQSTWVSFYFVFVCLRGLFKVHDFYHMSFCLFCFKRIVQSAWFVSHVVLFLFMCCCFCFRGFFKVHEFYDIPFFCVLICFEGIVKSTWVRWRGCFLCEGIVKRTWFWCVKNINIITTHTNNMTHNTNI